MSQFVRGDSVRVRVFVFDPDTTAETGVAPSTITIDIFDPNGAQVVSGTSMTAGAVTGEYYADYQSTVTSLVGTYTYRINAVVSAKTGRIKGSFTLSKETEV